MEHEPSKYKEMLTDTLVDVYISLPKEGREDWKDLDEHERDAVSRAVELCERAVEETKNGTMDVSIAEAGIIEVFQKVADRHPNIAEQVEVSRLYTQAKAWTGYSIRLAETGIPKPREFQEAQERAGRLYLLAGIAAGTKESTLTAYGCTSLLNSRHRQAATRLAEACSLDLIIADSPEEADELPRKFGETKESNIKSRIAEVNIIKPSDPRLN